MSGKQPVENKDNSYYRYVLNSFDTERNFQQKWKHAGREI